MNTQYVCHRCAYTWESVGFKVEPQDCYHCGAICVSPTRYVLPTPKPEPAAQIVSITDWLEGLS